MVSSEEEQSAVTQVLDCITGCSSVRYLLMCGVQVWVTAYSNAVLECIIDLNPCLHGAVQNHVAGTLAADTTCLNGASRQATFSVLCALALFNGIDHVGLPVELMVVLQQWCHHLQ